MEFTVRDWLKQGARLTVRVKIQPRGVPQRARAFVFVFMVAQARQDSDFHARHSWRPRAMASLMFYSQLEPMTQVRVTTTGFCGISRQRTRTVRKRSR